MVFPATDPFDNLNQEKLRRVCLNSLGQIHGLRQAFLRSCDDREHLREESPERRRLHFGAQLMGGVILAQGRMLPGADPEQFLRSLSARGRERNEEAAQTRSFAQVFADAGCATDPSLRDRMIPVLATWPDFDRGAFLDGRPQSDAFMAEFSADYPALRELAFEGSKPLRMVQAMGPAAEEGRPIVDQYMAAAFAGIPADRLEEFFQSAMERVDEPAMEFSDEPQLDREPEF